MKFPRSIRLDQSDPNIFSPAAEPGEWAVPGTFAFAGRDPATLTGKDKLAFHTGWLGTGSFGRCTLVEVAEIDEDAYSAVVDSLARHFVDTYGAPTLAAALSAAREEVEDAAGLCGHPTGSLLALEREVTGDSIAERFRIIRPDRAADHARIWEIVPDEGDESGPE